MKERGRERERERVMLMLLPLLCLFRLMLLLLLLLLQSGDDGPATVGIAAPPQKPHEKRSSARNLYRLAETLHDGIALLAIAVVFF